MVQVLVVALMSVVSTAYVGARVKRELRSLRQELGIRLDRMADQTGGG